MISGCTAPDFDGIMLQLLGGVELYLHRGGELDQIAVMIHEQPDGTFAAKVAARSRFVRETRALDGAIGDQMETELASGPSGCLAVYHVAPGRTGLTWFDVTSPINAAGGVA